MAKSIRILAVVLAVQILLALGLHFRGSGLSPAAEAGPLLSMSPDEVNKITIADNEAKPVTLQHSDGGWTLAARGFPADPDKVGRLLSQLNGLRTGEVVAQTKSARERFQVAGERFKRRITLHRDGQDPIRLYLGTSPGKDLTHARVEGQKPIQVVQFGTYDAPVKVADWQDKGVLQVPSDRVAGLEVDGLKLQRKDSGQASRDARKSARPVQWQAEKTPEGKTLQQSAARQFAKQLATLRFDEILGKQQPGGYNWDQPVLRFTVQRSDSEPVQYRLAKKGSNEDETRYALKASSRKEYFRIAAPTAKQLAGAASRGSLLRPETKKEASDPSAGPTDKAGASSSAES